MKMSVGKPIFFLVLVAASSWLTGMHNVNKAFFAAIEKNDNKALNHLLSNKLGDAIEGIHYVLDELDESEVDNATIDTLMRCATPKQLQAQKNNFFLKAGRKHVYFKDKLERKVAILKKIDRLSSSMKSFDLKSLDKNGTKKITKERIPTSTFSFRKLGALVVVGSLVAFLIHQHKQKTRNGNFLKS